MSRFSISVFLGIGCGLAGCHVVFSSKDTKDSADAPGDAVTNAIVDAQVDGSDTVANFAFITDAKFDGNLGGSAGADAKCKEAAKGLLVGNFVAVIGTAAPYSALNLTAVTDTTGWIRTDRAFVADKSSDFSNRVRNAIVLNERGVRPTETTIWTGLGADGSPVAANCGGFTSVVTSGGGGVGDTSSLIATLKAGTVGCDSKHHLLCISVGKPIPVSPLSPNGRKRIFLSTTADFGNRGLGIYDDMCAQEAAGLAPGMFVALLPTLTDSSLARVGLPPETFFIRVDGSPVGSLAKTPLTFLNQHADSSFVDARSIPQVWTGGSPNATSVLNANCAGWGSTGATGITGDPLHARALAYQAAISQSCPMLKRHIYCVEK